MSFMETLFNNTFFQMPLMEGMMYVAVVLLLGAGIAGIWDRMRGAPASRAGEPHDYELRKAA